MGGKVFQRQKYEKKMKLTNKKQQLKTKHYENNFNNLSRIRID